MWTELHASQSQKMNYPTDLISTIFTLMQLFTYHPPVFNYILLLQLIFILIVLFSPFSLFPAFFLLLYFCPNVVV